MSAATYGHSNVVAELISLGAYVDIQNNVSHFLSPHDTAKCFRSTSRVIE